MDPSVVFRLIDSSEFQYGLLAGVVALVIGWLMRRYRADWGLLWLATVAIASAWAQVLSVDRAEHGLLLYSWVAPAGVLAVLLMSYGLIRNRARLELAPALVVSLVGVWATVPDTEAVRVVLGVTAVLVWLAWPRLLLPIRPAGAVAVALVAVWAGIVGSVGRQGAYIGAFGAIASLALLSMPRNGLPARTTFFAHILLVVGWTRLAGLSQSALTAFALGSAITVVIVAARYALAWKRSVSSSPESPKSVV